jgi:hypothetical protein
MVGHRGRSGLCKENGTLFARVYRYLPVLPRSASAGKITR